MVNLLLPREAAAKLRVSRSKFYQLIKQGKVQPYNVGGKTVFKEPELEALVQKADKLVVRGTRGRPRKVLRPAEAVPPEPNGGVDHTLCFV
jgi:excisionase family DNA binding protein